MDADKIRLQSRTMIRLPVMDLTGFMMEGLAE